MRIGDIAKVDLKDGRAIVTMDVDPQYDDLVHTDATALLRPKTGLKDMFVELDPGTTRAPVAKRGLDDPGCATRCPTSTPTRSLASLDADTRDYLRLLVSGAGNGLDGPRRATCARSSAASSPPTATSRAVTGGGRRAPRATCAA